MSTITEPAVNGRASIIDLAIKASLNDNHIPTAAELAELTDAEAIAAVLNKAPGSSWKAADAEKAAKVTDNTQRVATLLVDIQKAIYASRDGWRERVAEMLAKVAILTGAAVPAKPAGPANTIIRTKLQEPGKYVMATKPAPKTAATIPGTADAPVYQWSREGFRGWSNCDTLESAMALKATHGDKVTIRKCDGSTITIVS